MLIKDWRSPWNIFLSIFSLKIRTFNLILGFFAALEAHMCWSKIIVSLDSWVDRSGHQGGSFNGSSCRSFIVQRSVYNLGGTGCRHYNHTLSVSFLDCRRVFTLIIYANKLGSGHNKLTWLLFHFRVVTIFGFHIWPVQWQWVKELSILFLWNIAVHVRSIFDVHWDWDNVNSWQLIPKTRIYFLKGWKNDARSGKTQRLLEYSGHSTQRKNFNLIR